MREKICAIYMIQNLDNGKVYIGSTRDFERRKHNHLYALYNGTHHSAELQKDFDNQCNIEFRIIEKLSDDISQDDMLSLESKYITARNSATSGYNKNTPSDNTKSHQDLEPGEIKYRIDILAALKEAGYNTNRIRKEKLLSDGTLQLIREGKIVNSANLAKICKLLNCQPGDILEYEE